MSEEKNTPRPNAFLCNDNTLYVSLAGVTTNTATPKSVSSGYIEENIKLNIPRIQHLESFMKIKGHHNPVVLIGGGPSLKNPKVIEELREMAKTCATIACGSSHDWCINNNIVPTYAVALDPDPITGNYMSKYSPSTIYLIASQCHPSLFENLKDRVLYMWHCYSDADREIFQKLEPDHIGIGGGCTVGLRSLSIAILLGYTNIHFFGFDSCLGEDDEHHAYGLSSEKEMEGLIGDNGKIHTIRIGPGEPTEKVYKCMGYQLAQVHHFKEFYQSHAQFFTPTFHGDGLLPDLCRLIQNEALKIEQSQKEL